MRNYSRDLATIAVLDEFLAATGMTIDHAFPFVVWQDADLAYQAYAKRRSASRGENLSSWDRGHLAGQQWVCVLPRLML